MRRAPARLGDRRQTAPEIPTSPLRLPRIHRPLPPVSSGPALLRWTTGVHRWALAVGMTAGVVWMAALAAVPVVIGVIIGQSGRRRR
jgi:hypothetical protein